MLVSAVVAVVVAVAGTVTAKLSGAFVPRLAASVTELSIETSTHTVVARLHLANSGWLDEHVEAARSATGGMTVSRWSGGPVPARGDGTLVVWLRLDSTPGQPDGVVLDLVLHRPWGTVSTRASIDMPPL